MPPWMGGGEMIESVFLDHSTYAEPPGRFEAGTPAIAEVGRLATALKGVVVVVGMGWVAVVFMRAGLAQHFTAP